MSSRPTRLYEVYSAICIMCRSEEIESKTLPVPTVCPGCQKKWRYRVRKAGTHWHVVTPMKSLYGVYMSLRHASNAAHKRLQWDREGKS